MILQHYCIFNQINRQYQIILAKVKIVPKTDQMKSFSGQHQI